MAQNNVDMVKRLLDYMLDNRISFSDLLTYAYNSNHIPLTKYKRILEIIDGR